jgi:hypothetical protein
MANSILICSPEKIYSGMSELEAARKYTQMAIEEFDSIVSFDNAYKKFQEIPDHESVVGIKEGRNLTRTLFINQPVVQVGTVPVELVSSSHLINPSHSLGDNLYLPDLEVVEFFGKRNAVQVAFDIVSNFYLQSGWKIFSPSNLGLSTEELEISSARENLGDRVKVCNFDQITSLAQSRLRYNPHSLAFRRDK